MHTLAWNHHDKAGMTSLITNTGERIIPRAFQSRADYLLYVRHVFAYEFARQQIAPSSVVLDLGCGEGYGTSLLSRHVRNIIGLDVDDDTVTHAALHYGSSDCAFQVYDGLTIPYDENTFDAVVSFQVIEHTQDDRRYLAEVSRTLKPHGVFILTTPNRLYRLKPGQKPRNRFHVREYAPEDFMRLLADRFPDSVVWGIRGNDEVERIEKERVRGNRLRRILSAVTRRDRGLNNGDMVHDGLDDFFVVKEHVSDSLDLLGVCRKGR